MNYLAHIVLSGENGRLQVGNFIGDAVKGSSFNGYPPAMADGIRLHRMIDHFTDHHPAVRGTVQTLRPHFGRYSGALLDIYFDYLLASRFNEFSAVPLRRFTRRFYLSLACNRRHLPERIKRFMWHFILTDRLGKYATVEGIFDSLAIMERYGRMKVSPDKATDYLTAHQEELWQVFEPFFRELQQHVKGALK